MSPLITVLPAVLLRFELGRELREQELPQDKSPNAFPTDLELALQIVLMQQLRSRPPTFDLSRDPGTATVLVVKFYFDPIGHTEALKNEWSRILYSPEFKTQALTTLGRLCREEESS
jgi:hypothetical protein